MESSPALRLSFSAAIALLLVGCGGDALPTHELSGSAMGTSYSVKLVAPGPNLDREKLGTDIGARLEALEQSMSTYRPDSELSMFNDSDSTDWISVSAELCQVVETALELSRLTGGAFDVTVGPLVNLWGFGPDAGRDAPPSAAEVDALREIVGYDKLESDCRVPALRKRLPALYVDLSAFAKGYAVDRIAELLEAHSIANYLVEIGGELRLRGTNGRGERWAIAIETPARGRRAVQTVLALSDTALATSGDYRNYFEHDGRYYSHAIDPKSGRPVEHEAASVTVIAAGAGRADAYATALLVLGPDDGIAFAERHALAAYFVIRGDSGFDERASSRFATEVERR